MELLAKLREITGPESVLTAPQDIEPFLTDHRRLFHGAARAVVFPSTTQQVAEVLRLCQAASISVVPQGGNTGYCGGATPDPSGRSIVLGLRRMNRIRSVDPANFALVAEAGCTLASVQQAATSADRFFPLSLGSQGSCQIGGNLATNAGGTAVLRYGMMRDLTLGIEAVLADGSLLSQLSPLRKDNTGYDLRNLLIGSEGTLAVITAACLKLFPTQRSAATAWIGLPSVSAAIELLALLRERSADRLSGCELIPAAALQLVLQQIPGVRDPGVTASPWYLLVELTSSAIEPLDDLLEAMLARAIELRSATDAVLARSEDHRQNLWRLRESVPEAQRRAGASLKHDIAVPVASLPALVDQGSALIARLVPEGFVVAYGHAGDGNLHFNVSQRVGTDTQAFLAHEPVLKRAMHDLVANLHGSFSAEHGIGQLKVQELARQAQPAELAAMRSIKQALDPRGLLNPGKVLSQP
ncbi:MAG: FAD-binding oxidoreductase [Steroidobacteraceae bacterium]